MKFSNIFVKNFRPYKDVKIDIDNEINRIVLLGKNDSGKTELLNAIFWCIWGSSLTKLQSFKEWRAASKKTDKITGIFNNSAFEELKPNEVLHVSVGLTFDLEKEEMYNVPSDDGKLMLQRSLFVEKNDEGEPRFLRPQDLTKEINYKSKFTNSVENIKFFEEDSDISTWAGHFTLSHPTSNANLERSDNAILDRNMYFPSIDVTKFFLLDSTLLRDYLSKGQTYNKANIDNITKVGDLNIIKNYINTVKKELFTDWNKLNKDKSQTTIHDESRVDKLESDLQKIDGDIDKNKLSEEWQVEFDARMKGDLHPPAPYHFRSIWNIKELEHRIDFIKGLIVSQSQDAVGTDEGKILLTERATNSNNHKIVERSLNDIQCDISDLYFKVNLVYNSRDDLKLFGKNNNITEYTPPKVTKDFLKALLDEETCCCGSELNEKNNKDRVEKIVQLMNKLIDKGTSGQISYIKSRAEDFYNPEEFKVRIQELDDKVIKANGLRDQAADLSRKIKNQDLQLMNLGGEKKIKDDIEEQRKFKTKEKIYQTYLDQKDSIHEKLQETKEQKKNKETEVNEIRTKLRNKVKKESKTDLLINSEDLAKEAIKRIDEIKDEFQSEMIATIKKDFEDEFQSMHWRDDYNITVDDNFRIDLKDNKGYILTNDASQGGSQMACLAFMKVLSNYSDLSMPLVADTPYGNLDTEPRTSVTKSLFKNNKTQVFFLATTAELGMPINLKNIIFPKKEKKKILCLEIEQQFTKDSNAYSSINVITTEKAIKKIEIEAAK